MQFRPCCWCLTLKVVGKAIFPSWWWHHVTSHFHYQKRTFFEKQLPFGDDCYHQFIVHRGWFIVGLTTLQANAMLGPSLPLRLCLYLSHCTDLRFLCNFSDNMNLDFLMNPLDWSGHQKKRNLFLEGQQEVEYKPGNHAQPWTCQIHPQTKAWDSG